MRFQALMPDVLHWLGIKKVDKMVSMSDMKYDAIVKSGIPIWNRYDIPGECSHHIATEPMELSSRLS
jgi:GTP cyclohydrolase II